MKKDAAILNPALIMIVIDTKQQNRSEYGDKTKI
jgi:hypothetical protein